MVPRCFRRLTSSRLPATDVLCFGPANMQHDVLPIGVLHPFPYPFRRGSRYCRLRQQAWSTNRQWSSLLPRGIQHLIPWSSVEPLALDHEIAILLVPQSGDHIIVIGGRTGRDDLRGATFSSLTMDAQTGKVAGASVQIGDPITEKGIIEVIRAGPRR